MKKIYKICGLVAMSFAVILSCIGIVFSNTPTTFAYDVSFTEASLLSTYVLGSELTAPEAKVSVGNIELDCTKQVLISPNGTAMTSNKYILSSVGEYTLRYYAQHNGRSVYADKKFKVEGGIVSLSGMYSTAYYGNSGEQKGNHQGLVVALASGETFTYNKPINLNGKTEKDILISLFATPESKGVSDVTEFTIRLTDAMDPNNYVEICQWANPYDGNEAKGYALYAGVRAHNQKLTGTAYKGSPSEETIIGIDGNYYKPYKDIHSYEELGFPSYMASLTAREGYDYVENKNWCSPFNYYFNYSELQMYGNPQEAGRTLGNNMMADFDDNQYFDQLWYGFTTGEVYLSIYSNNYNKAMFNFVIEKIYDDDLSIVNYTHNDAPQIVIDIEDESTPFAVINQYYNVIPAKAYSTIDGVMDCDVLVYEDYYGDKKAVPVVNGAFKPTKLDTTYHILYKATDSYGLEVIELRQIKVKSQREIEFLFEDDAVETLTGVTTLLKNVEFSGMNGDYTFEVVVKKGNVESVVEPNKNGEYEFWTLENGEYDVIYRLCDYNGIFEKSYTLNVASNPNSIFLGTSNLPKVFVKGGSYVLPGMKGIEGGTLNDLTATIKYKFDDGQEVNYQEGSVIKIKANEKVKVVYSLENSVKDLEYEIPVTDAGVEDESFLKDKYFYAENFISEVKDTSAIYSNVSQADASLSFVKPVLCVDLNFEFKILSDLFESLSFKLADTVEDKAVVIKFLKTGVNKYLVTVNEGQEVELAIPLTTKQYIFNFDGLNGVISVFGKTFQVENFEPFTKNLAYFGVEVEKASNTRIEIFSFCGQLINNQLGDFAAPQYYLDLEKGRREVGDEIVIKGFYVEDLLRFTHSEGLTVKGPDKKPCVTVDNIRMENITDFTREYVIKVEQVGIYTVSATYNDYYNEGFELYSGIRIEAVNSSPPTITVSNKNKLTSVKVGETYTLPTATAVDNQNNPIDVFILVQDTDEKVQIVSNGKYKFTKKGTYEIMFYAKDSKGIVAFERYTVKAS